MVILFYVMIGLFALDIILGIICGFIDGKRYLQVSKRLWWVEQHLDKELSDSVFSEFKDGEINGFDSSGNNKEFNAD